MADADNQSLRIRGPKPELQANRLSRVNQAVKELRKSGATFTIQDVADRSGISRATLYRSQELRSLVGVHGDPDRTLARVREQRIGARNDELRQEIRDLKGQLKDTEAAYDRLRERLSAAEEANRRHVATEASRGHAGELPSIVRSLQAVAERLGPAQCRSARRHIARVVHPDLFPSHSAAHQLASELLKTLNALVD